MEKTSDDRTAQPRFEECLPRDQAERLFQRAMHEETIFNSRMHNFLVIQSVLLAVVVLRQDGAAASPHTQVIIGAAFFLTAVWWYVQVRQKLKLDGLSERLEKALPEFSLTQAWRRRLTCLPTSTTLLAYGVPFAFLIIWGWILVSVRRH
jgi:hypothetical protein